MMKKMTKSHQGISPIIVIIIVAVILLGAGFFLYQRGNLPVSIPGVPVLNQRVSESDFSFIEDPVIKKHFVAQTNQAAFRTKIHSLAADLIFVNEIQIRGQDFNSRDIQQDLTGKEMKHKVEIGDTIYIKDFTDNKWWKQTITPEEEKELPEEQKPAEPIDFKEEYSKPDLKFKSLGKEPCGPSFPGLTCYKYEQTVAESGELSTARIFLFDDKKYLLRREEMTAGEFMTTSEYSYDGINIVPPSPTKDVPEGKNIYDYYFGYGDTGGYPSGKDLKIPQQIFDINERDLQNYIPPEFPDISPE